MKVCVVGSGYVGLVTAACLADFGNTVVCVDKDRKKVSELKKGIIDFYELGLKELVLKNSNAGRLIFTTELKAGVVPSEIVFLAVGTPSLPHGEADLSAVETVARQTVKILKSNKRLFKAIAVKSTVPVGTCARVASIFRSEGLMAKNYEIVSNPEFLREGKAVADFLHPDRIVVGAVSSKACGLMAELYRPLNARIVFMDQKSSEMVKYASNVFLATRISLVNELANICEKVGADVRKVVEGAGYDKRIGHSYLKPGIGYGGSCLPKDVAALIHLAKTNGNEAILLKSVHQVNINQRKKFVEKIVSLLRKVKGKTVCIWGLSFKPQTDDLRDAPSLTIIGYLLKEGFNVRAYDPMANEKAKLIFSQVKYCPDPYSAAKGSDVIALVTEWNEFREVDFGKLKKHTKKLVIVDGRNVLNEEVMKEQGIIYYGVGI